LKQEIKMNHLDTIKSSETKVIEMEILHGPKGLVFDKAARIATILLNTELTAYDISIIAAALNLAQIQGDPLNDENYVSSIVNVAFAAQFSLPNNPAEELEKEIVEVAKRFAPSEINIVQENNVNGETNENKSKNGSAKSANR